MAPGTHSRWFTFTAAMVVNAAGAFTSGCSFPGGGAVNLGGTLGQGATREDDAASVGLHSSITAQLGRDHGLVTGPEYEVAALVGPSAPRPRDRWRGSWLLGYASPPLPHRAPVGVELFVHGGGGRFPVADRTSLAWAFGPRVGLPIRLSGSQPLWDAEALLWPTHMLVPSLGANVYFPTDDGVDDAPRAELALHVTYRFHLWSTLVP